MKEIHKIILEDGDMDIIKELQIESPCSYCSDNLSYCCGCPKARKWEKEVEPYKNTPYWDLAEKYNDYQDLKEEIEELQLEINNKQKILNNLKKELIELKIIDEEN